MLVRPLTMQALIVDADENAVKLLHFALSNYLKDDSAIRKASNAADALELIQDSPVDVVISDLDRDETNGFHLLKSITSIDPTIEVILATARESSNAMPSALQLGVDDYFVQAFQPAQLIDSILFLRELNAQAAKHFDEFPDARINGLRVGLLAADRVF